ncbi:MAG: NUDIX hydrolase [Actinobacteria bacterium]|nr:NUDIX hydrolase [Actinomycetota bacterium]
MFDDSVIASGAVPSRQGESGTEYLLIHRAHRSDWTLPKGKVEPGEHVIAAAIREVREETGFAVVLGAPLPTQQYLVKDVPKAVFYWHATIVGGSFVPNDEVDEILWLPLNKAIKKLTYEHDADVLRAAAQLVPTTPFVVLRHTQAMKRAEWKLSNDALATNDASRPLTAVGRIQAVGLSGVLAAFGINTIHSSDSRRCRDTVGPFAGIRSLPIALEASLSEERHTENPTNAHERVSFLADSSDAIVLCTHRPVIPTVMQTLSERFNLTHEVPDAFDPALAPGAYVIYHRAQHDLQQIVAVERHRLTD